jgi:hypothetical protein
MSVDPCLAGLFTALSHQVTNARHRNGEPIQQQRGAEMRKAKDAQTSFVECYTGGVNRAGGDDSVGVCVGRSLRLSALPHKHSQYVLTEKQRKLLKR